MANIGNTPSQGTILRVEARKSFSLGLWLTDSRGRAVDLSGCTMTIVAKPSPIDTTSDASNIFAGNDMASINVPLLGYARFDIQATSLDQPAGEYEFAIVLRDVHGYSSVIVKGQLDIQQNAEVASAGILYATANPSQSLSVMLRESNSISVSVGSTLPPGMNFVPDNVMQAIENFDPEAIALVPMGGIVGYVLTKVTSDDYDMDWRPRENGTFGLDAAGQAAGKVPAALGDGTWTWSAVGIDATGVTAGYAPVANGSNGWAWAAVTTPKPDWNAAPGAAAEILNKPTLGTAAAAATTDFIGAATLVSAMQGIHFQTTIPVSGTNGHLYFVYEA